MASERAWWSAADALARLGLSVLVFDPDAEQEIEHLYDEIQGHGVVTVIHTPTLTGWELHAREELPQYDAAMAELLEGLAEVVLADTEDDGEID